MNFSFNVTPKNLTALLIKIILFLFIADIVSLILRVEGYRTAFGFARLFDFDTEFNAPSLYSSLAILLCAFLLRFIYLDEKKKIDKKEAVHWLILSYIFIYLSVDELLSLHEHIGEIFHSLSGFSGGLNDSRMWIIPYAVLLLLFLLFFMRFFLKLPFATKVAFFIAGVIYVAGAVGVELFGGQFILAHRRGILVYNLISIGEELLEMIGIVLFARALVSYIAKNSSLSYVSVALTTQE